MKNRRSFVVYALLLALCVLLPVLGFFGVTAGKEFYAPAEGIVYLRAKVTEVMEVSCDYGEDGEVLSADTRFAARVTSRGEYRGKTLEAVQNYSSFTPLNPREVKVGDSVILGHFEGVEMWNFIDYVRSDVLIVLAVFFAVLLAVFGRKKGFKTILSLTLTLAAVFFVFIPAVILGYNIYLWSVIICLYMIVMTLTIVNGISPMSLSASVGCMGGVLVSLAITFLTDYFIQITGNSDSHSIFLVYIGDGIDIKALVYASIIIGSVGAVMDVAVDISASLKELAYKLRTPSFMELLRSGIRIGRDVIGTMSNTLVLAYIGGSMCSLLLYIYNNAATPVYLFNIESIVIEILKILVGSIGILLTLPLTALVSAWLYTRPAMLRHILTEGQNGDSERESGADAFSEELESAGSFDGTEKK
ncbi:MAG: YibE/F family protein [Eubacteriales bacterium]